MERKSPCNRLTKGSFCEPHNVAANKASTQGSQQAVRSLAGSKLQEVSKMEVIYERCCGIDVHKNMLMACIFTGVRKKEVRKFGTMTDEILEMVEWLKNNECAVVAMESTGVYWKPVYNLLESEGIETIVVNAQHIKSVPGRKTDVKDAEWIADLVRHGLVRASFIPNREQREFREMVRYRNEIVNERSREINRIQAVLEGANIKLSSVITDITGQTGMGILRAIITNTTDPIELSKLAKGSTVSKIPELQRALKGSIGTHQIQMLTHQLEHIEFLTKQISQMDEEVKKNRNYRRMYNVA